MSHERVNRADTPPLEAIERRARLRPVPEDLSVIVAGRAAWTRVLGILLLVSTDLCALFLSGAAAYALWALPEKGQTATMYADLAPLLSLFVVGYALLGLYPGFGLGPVETLRR